VMTRYNAVESFKIGYSCEERTGLHLHEDLCHVWVAGRDGAPLPAGEPGAVLLTNLVNRATVLINYPLGDVAALSDAVCPCGRKLRLLHELEGRVEDVIALDDGRFVHPRAVWQVFKDDAAVLQYQLTQCAPTRFELTLATEDEAAFRAAIERGRPRLAALLGDGAEIDARRSDPLRAPGGAKFRAVVALRPPAVEAAAALVEVPVAPAEAAEAPPDGPRR
jgi:phenylacetate-CoA ligase